MRSFDPHSARGSVLVYAMLLSIFAVILGYIIFNKSEVLIENLSYQNYNAKLLKNVQEKSKNAIEYAVHLNTDGSGFTNTRSCPTNVTMSGTTASGTLEVIDTFPYFDGNALFCSGSTASGNLLLSYSSDYVTFLTGTYTDSININPTAGTGILTGTFSDPEAKHMSFVVPLTTSGLDADLNSDNYTAYSTGTIRYPGGYFDNDTLARTTIFGYVRSGIGWYNIFWNNAATNAYIARNTNNSDPYHALLPHTSTGFLYLDIDAPYSIRIMEFSSGAYGETHELKRLSDTQYTSGTGGIGYLQTDGSLSGTHISGDGARAFNFREKNYAVFLSWSGGATYLKYKITGVNETGSGLYLNPLDDSSETFIKYLGNDIIINSENNYLSKQFEVTLPKPGTNISNGLQFLSCILGNAGIGCSVY